MIKRIVLTGGPCAGKTTILTKIKQYLTDNGYKVLIVNESATELINCGITPHESSVGLLKFQKIIMSYQYQKEEVYSELIKSTTDDVVIIYDRGLMDNKAYISDMEFEIVLRNLSDMLGYTVDIMDILSRYDMVIHLVTSAGNRGYNLENNKARYESENEAILLDKRTMFAWNLHGNLKVVDSKDNFDDKVSLVINLIKDCVESNDTKREYTYCRKP